MAKVYETINREGVSVCLYECRHNSECPYVVTMDGKAKTYCDSMKDAYHEYNVLAR